MSPPIFSRSGSLDPVALPPNAWQRRARVLQSLAEQTLPHRQWVDRLLEAQRDQHLSVDPNFLEQLNALGREPDNEMFRVGLLNLAEGLAEDSDDGIRLAGLIYQGLADSGGQGGDQARQSLEVLQGRGPWGLRLENFLHQLPRQTLNSTTLFSLGLATGVATVARTGLLSRLLLAENPGILAQSLGPRTLAGFGAFCLEVPTFVLAEKGLRALSGENVSWSSTEWSSAFLNLGLLKLFHAGSASMLEHWSQNSAVSGFESHFLRFSRSALPNLAAFAGILGARSLESRWGMRPAANADTILFDSMTFFLQANLAGHLVSRAMGPGWQGLESELSARARNLPKIDWSRVFTRGLPQLQPAMVGAFSTDVYPRAERASPLPQNLVVSNEALKGDSPSGIFPARSGSGGPPSGEGRIRLVQERLQQWAQPRIDRTYTPRFPVQTEPKPLKRIGILTSGGDGPAENAAIAALVRGAIRTYGWQPIGIFDGFKGLLEPEGRIMPLSLAEMEGDVALQFISKRLNGREASADALAAHRGIETFGGDLLRSSRTNPVLNDPSAETVKKTMRDFSIDGLVVMGGNGSLKATNALHAAGVPVVFIPQSIDADIPGSEISIGFPSAVAKGASEIPHFYNTGQSCDRWFFVEIMGQHYGALALSIANEARVDSVFTELSRPMDEIAATIADHRQFGKNHGVILVSESVLFQGEGGLNIQPPRGVDKHGRLLVESGDIARWLSQQITELGIPHTRSASLGYLLRGAYPSPHDIDLAEVLAEGALHLVDSAHWGRMSAVRFRPRSSTLQLSFPEISKVAGQVKILSPEYQEAVLQNLKHGERP